MLKFLRGEQVIWLKGKKKERVIFIEMTSKHNCTIVTERGMLTQAFIIDLTKEGVDVEFGGENQNDVIELARVAS